MKKNLIFVLGVLMLSLPVSYSVAQEAKPVAKVEAEAPATLPAVAKPEVKVVSKALTETTAKEEVKSEVAKVTEPSADLSWWKVILRYSLELVFTVLGLLASVFVTVLMRMSARAFRNWPCAFQG